MSIYLAKKITRVNIREALLDDVTILADFQQKMAVETENVVLDNILLLEGIQQLFQHPAKGKYYVAELNSEVVGCLMTTFEWSEWRNGTVLWIQSVYVSKEQRGKGVYKKMYEYIQDLVNKDPALKGIRLYADKSNKNAHDVYSKMGMNGDHYIVYEWMKQ